MIDMTEILEIVNTSVVSVRMPTRVHTQLYGKYVWSSLRRFLIPWSVLSEQPLIIIFVREMLPIKRQQAVVAVARHMTGHFVLATGTSPSLVGIVTYSSIGMTDAIALFAAL